MQHAVIEDYKQGKGRSYRVYGIYTFVNGRQMCLCVNKEATGKSF